MSKRFLKNISSSISFFTGSLVAIAVCSVATVARAIPEASTTGYPVVSSSEVGSLYCYMTTSDNKTLNLNRLCGEVSGSSTAGYGAASTYGGYSSGGYSSGSYGASGNCQYSWQLDSAGRACGGRAANIRPSGNNGGYSPIYNSGYGGNYSGSYGSSGGSTYVRPYTRSDGTSVRGHYRSK